MNAKPADLGSEQDHYDISRAAREEHRRGLGRAAEAAARPQDAREILKDVQRKLAEWPSPDEPVLFGRIDLEPTPEDGGRTYYLGAMSVLDAQPPPLVINFNSPMAASYYKATPATPLGLLRKRTFDVDAHRLLDYEEVVLKELEADLQALRSALQGPHDALLKDLESSRDGSMRHIARTIGAAQYDVISHPLNRLLVVQGGPGTGKTAIALHRVSYWLYNSQEAADPADRLAPTDVLVIGPSQAFTRYIGRLLPGLGSGEVSYQHLRNLGPQTSTGRGEPMPLARLKGDGRMAGLLSRALQSRIRVPEGGLDVGPAGARVTISAERVQSRVDQLRELPYRTGRDLLRTWLGDEANSPDRDFSGEQINAALERVWPLPTPQRFVQELLASRDQLLNAAGEDFNAAEIQSLHRQAAPRISEESWSDSDVALIDEIEWLMEGRAQSFKHIVVDEAQDLSDMQLRSVRRRSLNGSMTVVGDLAQSTGPHARPDWDGIVEGLKKGLTVDVRELELGYRVPSQVFEFAAQLLPYAAPSVMVPQVIRRGPADPELSEHDVDDVADGAVAAASEHAGRGAFVGIVCPATFRGDLEAALARKSVKWADGDLTGVTGSLSSINVVSPETAKGLEFDAVVVVEPEEIVKSDPHGLRLLYIALTRTTAYLSVLHSGRAMPLPQSAAGPGVGGSEPSPPGLRAVANPPRNARQAHPDDAHAAPEQPAHSSAIEGQPAASPFDLSAAVVTAAVGGLAREIRRAVPGDQWATLIDQLRRELGVSDEQLYDMLE